MDTTLMRIRGRKSEEKGNKVQTQGAGLTRGCYRDDRDEEEKGGNGHKFKYKVQGWQRMLHRGGRGKKKKKQA